MWVRVYQKKRIKEAIGSALGLFVSWAKYFFIDRIKGQFKLSSWLGDFWMRLYSFVLFFLLSFALRSSFSINLLESDEAIERAVENQLKKPFVLKDLTFASNTQMPLYELKQLVGLKSGDIVLAQKVTKFLTLVKRKRHYQRVNITIDEKENDQSSLHFRFKGIWVLRDVIIHGISLGKENYRHYYKGESGEPFSFDLHKESLDRYKKMFKEKGFFTATISDFFSFHQKNRSVDVNLYLQKGYRFDVSKVVVQVEGSDDSKELLELEERLYRNYFLRMKGRKYDVEFIQKYIKAAKDDLALQGFPEYSFKIQERIHENLARVELHFKISVGKKRSMTFLGNHFFSTQVLQKKIARMGDVAGILPLSLLAQDLIDFYKEKGFWDVKIETHEEKGENNFFITEGGRVQVISIDLKGVSFKKSDLLRKHFLRFKFKKYFDRELLNKALDSLIKWYQKNGYQDVQILKEQYEPTPKKLQYRLSLFVEEGPCYHFENVSIEGHEDLLSYEPFFSLNGNKKKVPFTYEALQHQRNWLIDHFKNKGYFAVRVVPEVHTEGQEKYVTWKVSEGKLAYFGKTVIQGVTKLPYERILREIAYKEGEPWSVDRLRKSRENLRELELFKHIVMYPQTLKDDDNVRHTIINLLEEDPFEIRIRMGLQQISRNFAFKKGSTYKIGGSALWRNITNSADYFRIDTDFTRFKRYIRASYIRPHILNSPLRLLIRAYDNHYIQPIVLGSKEPLYEVLQQGMLIGVKGEKNGVTRGITAGIDWMETKNISTVLAEAITFSPDLIERKIPYLFIEPNIFIDRLVDKVDPQKGFFSIFSLKAMIPFKKSSYFFKVMAEHSVFIPLFEGTVLAARAKIGHIFRQEFRKIMPPERFYLGGSHSLRGYPPDHCPPLGNFVNEKGEQRWVPQGGKTIMNLNIEFRFPTLVGPLKGALFQDFGVLVQDSPIISVDTTKLAASGFGLRYLTPIGPLRFDIGWKWKKTRPEESRHAWFLIFGHAF